MHRTALITGINGQDGSYLAEFLLEKDYKVVGTIRRNSVAENQTSRLDHIFDDVYLEYADMLDSGSLSRVLNKYKPNEIYNLAAQSHVRVSFEQPEYTTQVCGLGVLKLLETVKNLPRSYWPKIYQASSSEMFGNSVDPDGFQRETTPMHPVSPYGCAKLFAYSLCKNYRNSYGMFIANGILFNHESPRRGSNFITAKIAKAVAEIKANKRSSLILGNLNSARDWGHAKDYVEAMWLMLQRHRAEDFVIATGESNTVRHLCEITFAAAGIKNYEEFIFVDSRHMRPEELNVLKGDYGKAKDELGWSPKTKINEIMSELLTYWQNKV